MHTHIYAHTHIHTYMHSHIHTYTTPCHTHTEFWVRVKFCTTKQHKDKSISILFIWSKVAMGHLRWMRLKWISGTNWGHKWPKELSHGRVVDLCVNTKGSFREEGGLRTEGVRSMRQKMKKCQRRWIWWPQLMQGSLTPVPYPPAPAIPIGQE